MPGYRELVSALEKLNLLQWMPLRNPDTFPQSPGFIEETYVVLGWRRPMMEYVQEAHRNYSKISNSRSKVKPLVRWRRSRPSIDVGCVSYSSVESAEKKLEIHRIPGISSVQPRGSADVLTGQLHVGSSSGRQNVPQPQILPPPMRETSSTHSKEPTLPENVLMVVNTDLGKVLVSFPPQPVPKPPNPPPSQTFPATGLTLVDLLKSSWPPCNAGGLNPKFQSPYAPSSSAASVPWNAQQPARCCTWNPHCSQTPLAVRTPQPAPALLSPPKIQTLGTSNICLPPGSRSSETAGTPSINLTGDPNPHCRICPSKKNQSPPCLPGIVGDSTIVYSKKRSNKTELKATKKQKRSAHYQSARRTTGPPKTRLTIQEMKILYCPEECYVRLERMKLTTIRRLCRRKNFRGKVGKNGHSTGPSQQSAPFRKPRTKPMFCSGVENIVPKLKISLKHLSSTNEANPSLDSAGSKHLDDDISEKENFPVDIEGSKIDLCLSLPFKRSSSPILDSPPMKKIDLSLVKFLDLKTGDLTTTFIKSEDSAKNSAFSDSFFNMAMPDVNLNYKVPTAVSAGGELNLKSLNCTEFEARPSLIVTMKKVDSWENLLCNICSCTFTNVQEWTCHYSEGCTSAVTDHRLSPNHNLNPVF